MTRLRIATAGWTVPRAVADRFPATGSGLERYAARFDAVEINSTFYRSHRPATLARWRDATPVGFRFAIKAPRAFTHEARLHRADELLTRLREETAELGDRLGPLLVQLPPSLAFEAAVAGPAFCAARALWPQPVVCEPRHVSWFEPEAERLLEEAGVARVAADPARHPAAGRPGGWSGFAYWRLHGAPRTYVSAYDDDQLSALASLLRAHPAPEVWCVFDNTTAGAAAANALTLQALAG